MAEKYDGRISAIPYPLAITFYNGEPKLVEVLAITGKRARLRRPGSVPGSEIRTLPLIALYTYDEDIWERLQIQMQKFKVIKGRIGEIAQSLEPMASGFELPQGSAPDAFWK